VLISQNSNEHIEPEFSEQQSATPFMKHLSSVRDLEKLEDILSDLVLETLWVNTRYGQVKIIEMERS